MTNNGHFADRTYRQVFENGLTLLVLENPANPTVEVRGAFRGGLYFEPGAPYGVSKFTAAMLMRGSRRHDKIQIAQQLEDVGADLDFAGGRFLVNLSGHCLKKDLRRLLDTAAEVMLEPSFPAEEIERLRQQVVGGIQRSQEDTGARAFERLSQLIYVPTHPLYRRPAIERIAAVESFGREDLERYYQVTYGARSMILVVVGDVRAQECEQWVRALWGAWRPGPSLEIDIPRTIPKPPPRSEWVEMSDKASVDIMQGHAGQLRRTDSAYYAAVLGNAALGQSTLSSRLGLRVRDQEGLSYGIVSRFFEPSYADGPWGISVTVNPGNIEQAIKSTGEVLERYLSEGIGDSELESEQSAFVGSFIVGLGTNAGIASHLLSAEAYGFGPQHLDAYPEMVRRVTLDEVNQAIRTFIRPEALLTVMAGQPLTRS